MGFFETYKNILLVIVILLFVQFWLGMVTNLFITLPSAAKVISLNYSGSPEVLTHIFNGILVVASAGALIIYGTKLKIALISKLSIIALVFVIIAVINGFTFAFYGQNNSYSIGMAMSFLIIYTVYFIEFYLIGKAIVATSSKVTSQG